MEHDSFQTLLSLTSINNSFNNKLFELQKKPVVLSPLSISYAMLMTYFGCSGSTREELKNVFNINSESEEHLLNEMGLLMRNLKNSIVKCIIANKAFVNQSVTLNEKYTDFIKQIGGIENVDFVDPKTLNLINHWVSENTCDLIKQLL